MRTNSFLRSSAEAPETYRRFIAEIKKSVVAKGLSWDIPVDSTGAPLAGRDWDLRRLNGCHERYAAGTVGFAIEADIRELARDAGWPPARLPAGNVLCDDAQEFVLALLAHRCLAGQTTGNAQILAKAARRLLSTTVSPPWALTAGDFDALLSLKQWSEKGQRDFRCIAKLVDTNLLSVACPVEPAIAHKAMMPLLSKLPDRQSGENLPEKKALFELARIVFQETPRAFNDAVYFAMIKLVILTGLRIQEIVTLPADCLQWDEHVDIVTGGRSDSVGGVGKSLRLRYYAEKQRDGAPGLLVERYQHVPARFEKLVASAVKMIRRATAPLRRTLAAQSERPEDFKRSDLRSFRTSTGRVDNTWGRLLLTLGEAGAFPLDRPLAAGEAISTPHGPRIYNVLGRAFGSGSLSFFKKYGATPEARAYSVTPHSLRHLMNTELFRLNVPDTAITHQFGRTSVAQSYEYDHRSLAEKLRFVQLPAVAKSLAPTGSAQELVAKMVVSGAAATSHIGQSFKRIQSEHGDAAAFSYLAANSDGFHVTPYGFCTNSFSVNPCARHLKCFDNCKHFAASGEQQHLITLNKLRESLELMRTKVEAKPPHSVGRRNQLLHAQRLLGGVNAALEAQPGTSVFNDGVDHAHPDTDLFR